jgi:hypothetical protein
MRRSTAFVLALLLAAATTSAAEVYRWTDRNRVVHYSDSPPNPDARPARLPPIQTFHGDPGADPFAGAPAPPSSAAAAAAVVPPRILAPADGTTDRDANGHLLVRVKADLAPGEGLLYEVDGQPQTIRRRWRCRWIWRGWSAGRTRSRWR